MSLQSVSEAFLEDNPECLTSVAVHDECLTYSESFVHYLGADGIEAAVVSGFEMIGNIILQGHSAVLVDDTVYDWTIRQFDPTATVPAVMPLTQWREQWKELGK